ncbi:MAG: hypothetical protein JO269_00385 [Burkholderiaceae bacterium]|nr:hypothetical protein [Burkholderiaceae bacterium]
MFNPRARIQLVPIPGYHPCVVVDDFLQDPQSLVNFALDNREHFSMALPDTFPGLELPMSEVFSARLNDFFIQHVRNHLGARRTESVYSRLSMATLQPHELSPWQRICHTDRLSASPTQCFAASVLYLFHDASLGGTSFYRPRMPPDELHRLYYAPDSPWCSMSNEAFTEVLGAAPAYQTASNEYFELLCTIPPAWNRVIFYDGCVFHSGHITAPQMLSADPVHGRLTLNGFFTCRRAAAPA